MPKENIYDKIPAKPTKYNGRLFRSRLEARAMVYFERINMRPEYEPLDLPGWSPDFKVFSSHGNALLVEVKPTYNSFDITKILKAINLDETPIILLHPEELLLLSWGGFKTVDLKNDPDWIEAANVVQFLKPEVCRG